MCLECNGDGIADLKGDMGTYSMGCPRCNGYSYLKVAHPEQCEYCLDTRIGDLPVKIGDQIFSGKYLDLINALKPTEFFLGEYFLKFKYSTGVGVLMAVRNIDPVLSLTEEPEPEA